MAPVETRSSGSKPALRSSQAKGEAPLVCADESTTRKKQAAIRKPETGCVCVVGRVESRSHRSRRRQVCESLVQVAVADTAQMPAVVQMRWMRWRSCGFGDRRFRCSGGAATAGTATAARFASAAKVGVVAVPHNPGPVSQVGGGSSPPALVLSEPLSAPLTHSCRTFHIAHLQLHQQPPSSLRRVKAATLQTIRTIHSAATRAPATISSLRRFSSTARMSELKWPSARVRNSFFEFFEQRGHTIGMIKLRKTRTSA